MPKPPRTTVFLAKPGRYAKPKRGAKLFQSGSTMEGRTPWLAYTTVPRSGANTRALPRVSAGDAAYSYRSPKLSVRFVSVAPIASESEPTPPNPDGLKSGTPKSNGFGEVFFNPKTWLA